MDAAYRDEGEAARVTVERLDEENAALRARIANLELKLKAAEGTIGLGRGTRGSWRWAAVGGAVLLGAGGAFAVARRATPAPNLPSAMGTPKVCAWDGHSTPADLPGTAKAHAELELGFVAATLDKTKGALLGCWREEGPNGHGLVAVTFESDGTVSSVELDSPFAGTAAGACVSDLFRKARSPITLDQRVRVTDGFIVNRPSYNTL